MAHKDTSEAFFIFNDLTVAEEGHYKLQFTLQEIQRGWAIGIARLEPQLTVYRSNGLHIANLESVTSKEIESE
jgi:hypothetical protein